MTDAPANVVLPYSRFLEAQKRRRMNPSELHPPDQPDTIDVETGMPEAEAAASRAELPTTR